ncbi:hypothetical protein CQ12_32285 [Bradyrhizobium jicamae]|uniref:Uncharacterized protein n=1 Tax=Bradyrhizobium jicamae TaxID=280332 RepID=A0A0R3M4D4_9BRAD|nr:hypothetical protein [Bradyrhizobium jicamae]KRR14921.1 hypothetical protein CQ12_32285 [Bradyrhizobium jicamae]
MPVYLCNKTDQAMRDIEIGTVGLTIKLSMSTPDATGKTPLATTRTSLAIEQLAPNTAVLIDRYDPMLDADFITSYDVAFIDRKAQRQRRRCMIGPGGPSVPFYRVC